MTYRLILLRLRLCGGQVGHVSSDGTFTPWLPVFLILSVAAIGACGQRRSDAELEDYVRQFHIDLDKGRHRGIFQKADIEFQKSTGEPSLVELLTTIRQRLGPSARVQVTCLNYDLVSDRWQPC